MRDAFDQYYMFTIKDDITEVPAALLDHVNWQIVISSYVVCLGISYLMG